MESALQSIRKAAASAKATGGKPTLKRDLKDTDEYDKSAVKNVVSMLSSLHTAKGSLSDMLDVMGSVSAHEISHDGMLGGRGYVMAIRGIRDDVTTAINLVTNLVDTLSDELTNPKWGLSKEEVEKYKQESRGEQKSSGDDIGTDQAGTSSDGDVIQEDDEQDGEDLDKIMDMFGDSAPSSHEETKDSQVLPEPAEDKEDPGAGSEPSTATTPEPVPEAPADDANAHVAPTAVSESDQMKHLDNLMDPESALNLPYNKLAALASSMFADKVACSLRAPIVYNILDGYVDH